MKISEKAVLISGGASGLGAATAKYLSNCGAHVGIFDIDEERGLEVSVQCKGRFFAANVYNEE